MECSILVNRSQLLQRKRNDYEKFDLANDIRKNMVKAMEKFAHLKLNLYRWTDLV